MSKLHDKSSSGHAYCAAGTHLGPGNTNDSNVRVTHFIDDSDDSDIFVDICLLCFPKITIQQCKVCNLLRVIHRNSFFMMVTWNFLPSGICSSH